MGYLNTQKVHSDQSFLQIVHNVVERRAIHGHETKGVISSLLSRGMPKDNECGDEGGGNHADLNDVVNPGVAPEEF